MLFTWIFWQDAVSRGIRTFCQTLLAAWGGNALNVWSADWHQSLGLAAGSALLALLMAVDRSGAVLAASNAPSETVVVEPVAFVAPFQHGCGDKLR
jgi:F0F1-type ATP synthase membrane subunit a